MGAVIIHFGKVCSHGLSCNWSSYIRVFLFCIRLAELVELDEFY